MSKKRLKPDEQTTAGRVAILCQDLWSSSRTKMAADTGITLAGVCDVLSGRRAPGREILRAIAADPRVDATWLLTGVNRTRLPIAANLLPGLPQNHANLVTGEQYAVAESRYRPTRYAFRLAPAHIDLLPRNLAVLSGDMLVIETDRAHWQDSPGNLAERICVVRPDPARAELVSLGFTDARGGIFFGTAGELANAEAVARRPVPRMRQLILHSACVSEAKTTEPTPRKLEVANVVGVVAFLGRE